jgi:hypothetical protein
VYATAGKSNPRLLKCFVNHIIAKDLSGFNSQDLSNIMGAYANAGQSQLLLYQKLANVSIKRCGEFSSKEVANFLWAYAIIGQRDQRLFLSFAPIVKSRFSKHRLGICCGRRCCSVAFRF